MAVQVKPDSQSRFAGVVTNGHPLRRRTGSASYCHNLRVMPGEWLRTWGGRKTRLYQASGEFRWFHEYRDPQYAGWSNHIAQHWVTGPTVKWRWFALSNFVISDLLTISGANDSNFSASNKAACCNLRDRAILYNGLGTKDGSGSTPPFSMYLADINQKFYMGLDPWLGGSAPPTVNVSGAGSITTTGPRKLYVGLYNERTGHFSNGVFCATINALTNKEIALSALNNIKYVHHDLVERGFLYWVFYLTLDNGEVPYLLMNGYDPVKVIVTTTTGTITTLADVYSASGNWLDTTKEMPRENFPPRPMRWIASVNGRLYGALMAGGNGVVAGAEFHYTPPTNRYAGIAYSSTYEELANNNTIGNPEESWPLSNWTATPNGEIPIAGNPAPDGFRLLAHTATHTWLVEEAADGVHEWEAISKVHGIARVECYCETQHGPVWLTQRNQLATLQGTSVEILSTEYQTLFKGKTPRFITYVLDPVNEIDRVECYFTDGTGVVHDFVSRTGYSITGDYTAAATLTTNVTNKQYHVVAKQHIYTQAGQPENGAEKVANEDYTGPSTTAKTGISGEWRSQWLDYGDPINRKERSWMDMLGDTDRIVLEWYDNYEEFTNANLKTAVKDRADKAGYTRHKFSNRFPQASKYVIKITGRTDIDEHPTPDQYGDQGPNVQFAGSVLESLTTITAQVNRT